jgi:hypothetical protein
LEAQRSKAVGRQTMRIRVVHESALLCKDYLFRLYVSQIDTNAQRRAGANNGLRRTVNVLLELNRSLEKVAYAAHVHGRKASRPLSVVTYIIRTLWYGYPFL